VIGREVAVKVIRPSWPTMMFIRRFEADAERVPA
jgi:hypothetical protein